MIALDTCSLVAYFEGLAGEDVEAIEWAFTHQQAVFPPVVVSELLSDPALPKKWKKLVSEVPSLELIDGYWERSGLTRSILIGRGIKAKLADTLIAQSCIDHDLPLVTRDHDFGSFTKLGLKLFLPRI